MDLTEMEEIIERDLPGQRVSNKSLINEDVSRDSDQSLETEKPEASTPEFQTLREKYLSEQFFGSADSANFVNSEEYAQNDSSGDSQLDDDQAEDIIVATRPKVSTDLRDDSSQLKAAVISATEKKVIGQQG